MGDEVVAALIQTIESQANKKVLKIIVADDRPLEDRLEALVYFADGSAMDSVITVQTVGDALALRVRGNYI